MNKISYSLFVLFLLFSCTKKIVWTNSEMWNKAYKFDSKIELVPITESSKRILCKNYGPGCKVGSGKRILVRKVELIVVEFKTLEQARSEAIRLNQYHTRNWLLDDVHDEPVLENFVKEVFDAKKPNKKN